MIEVALSGPPLGPNQIAWLEAGLRTIADTGLTGAEMITTAMLVSGYVQIEVRFAFDLAQAEQRTGVAAATQGAASEPAPTRI
jgi:Tetracyclin repressor-like, C-terminal domain